ncbi:MAG TPA: penicillin acylase family protein, partial [Gemmatimonadales bacterium]|nr:penicillin acylase family protein [Gemmatimonadales bacterium]
MRIIAFLLVTAACATRAPAGAPAAGGDLERWRRHAAQVTIVRDSWGIAHVHGRTDADAVFGMIYAQAEDDFNRVETNYLNSMGRLAEAEGDAAIWQDLRMKLFINPDSMKAKYGATPAWLRVLMGAWADGLNFYLHSHPDVKPRVITRFEPWMALTFSEGSIGGDIERVDLAELEAFYGEQTSRPEPRTTGGRTVPPGALREPTGSNGFAIAPSNTRAGRALLLINPHTSFYFRSELQMTSDEGLNAYGAATWGQFFIYQGFNDRLGWMHTSSTVDVVDEFAETVLRRDDRLVYRYGNEERPVTVERITVPYRTGAGMARREFTVYRTHHGPIVRSAGGRWIAIRLMEKPIEALSQSYLRTKARNLTEFRKVLELQANSSNNTIYADADGNIAYFHPQFIPRRNDRFDWTRPVDGSDVATEWGPLHPDEEDPHVVNPPNGWIQNTNNWPYSAAGPYSPKRDSFPRYMDAEGENARGVNAMRVLEARKDFTPATLRDAAYDTRLSAFERLIPALLAAFDQSSGNQPYTAKLAEPIAALRQWDRRWSVESVPTSLAVYWGEALYQLVRADASAAPEGAIEYMALRSTPDQRLDALATAVERLTSDFGTWRTPWGEINRFQRRTGDIVQPFSDSATSLAVGFTSGMWGSLAAFGTATPSGAKRRYGVGGNSFVAVVEFGRDSVR